MFQRILIIAILPALLAACATSPLGRSQLRIAPDAEVERMGATAYQQIKQKTPVSRDPRANSYVNCVADAITRQVGRGQWEVNIFQDPSPNAFALPGGKIGVNTGMLGVAKNQDQLATVIAHEVAHVLAGHANERISNQYATQTGVQLIEALAGANGGALAGLLGVGAQYAVILPFSRTQESEADLLGLDLMSRAGFNPRASVDLWRNMERAGGARAPEFLSTHPSGPRRIGDLSARIPQDIAVFERARASGNDSRCGR